MGFLTLAPFKAGYTGPQSGMAALKLLQSLPSVHPLSSEHEESLRRSEVTDNANPDPQSRPNVNVFIDRYFECYHPAYPLLHEGSFRARAWGALAKPKDGSWPLLYNMVLAVGAFTGDTGGTSYDLEFFRLAKQAISLSVVEKGSLSYVQGLALMANYLQKRNKPNAGFALVGIAWSMAMSIGLHREFGAYGTTPFAMEIRRRTWWTLFTFVSGAQLTLGRPPASLVGVSVKPPTNLDDADLAVDMESLPTAKNGPTATSSLIAQIPLATIANEVQATLLTSRVPSVETVDRLDLDIEAWAASLPSYMSSETSTAPQVEYPKRVLLWRSHHLRIVLNRPFLFLTINNSADINSSDARVYRCISTADTCVESISRFLSNNPGITRGFAWYATYWLISASFIHAICFAHAPNASTAGQWKSMLQYSISTLEKLSTIHPMAQRAKQILQRFHGKDRPDSVVMQVRY
jgi:transcriptional regulatory protein GAL4